MVGSMEGRQGRVYLEYVKGLTNKFGEGEISSWQCNVKKSIKANLERYHIYRYSTRRASITLLAL